MDLLKDDSFEDATFRNLQHANVTLTSKEFVDVKFVKCSFQDATFQNCRFVDCTFSKCNLNMLNVTGSRFTDVTFEECQAVGINWAKAVWDKGGYFRAIHFLDSTLNYSSLFGLKLHKMKMIRCVAREVDFATADLTGGIFTHTDFSGSAFMKTNLTEADFSHATNYAIAPQDNILKKAKFTLPDALSLLHHLGITLVEPER